MVNSSARVAALGRVEKPQDTADVVRSWRGRTPGGLSGKNIWANAGMV
ncbi:hypothetical protein FTUN_8835 [Frigoriglobus tundricola]|uniref:Uncharacterized protein n=1 Tax=Frigoriglobus tundricola TaxID=2774151 RepID=A0A6M5Z548_9BACT|nr:hypothetical protein FTUN_8835 [Frigoriglobus tundricola]